MVKIYRLDNRITDNNPIIKTYRPDNSIIKICRHDNSNDLNLWNQ